MRRASPLLLSLCAVFLSASNASNAYAGGGFLPPLRADVSPTSMMAEGKSSVGLHVLAGLHWASVSPSWRTNVDVGIGYTYERFGIPGTNLIARTVGGGQSAAPALSSNAHLGVHGLYFELAERLSGSRHRRSWLGLRGEFLFGSDGRGGSGTGAGLIARASWELFSNAKIASGGAAILGAVALGTFMELGVRHLPDGRAAVTSTAGLSMRLPMVLAGR